MCSLKQGHCSSYLWPTGLDLGLGCLGWGGPPLEPLLACWPAGLRAKAAPRAHGPFGLFSFTPSLSSWLARPNCSLPLPATKRPACAPHRRYQHPHTPTSLLLHCKRQTYCQRLLRGPQSLPSVHACHQHRKVRLTAYSLLGASSSAFFVLCRQLFAFSIHPVLPAYFREFPVWHERILRSNKVGPFSDKTTFYTCFPQP